MKKHKYAFSVDEPKLQIPPAGDFAALLSTVKAKTPWYFQTPTVIGFASIAAITVAGFWYFNSNKMATTPPHNPSEVPTSAVTNAQNDLVINNQVAPFELPKSIQKMELGSFTAIKQQPISDYTDKASDYNFQAAISPNIGLPISTASFDPFTSTKTALLPWKLQYPFDTIIIKVSSLPLQLNIGDGNVLTIPKDAFVSKSGAPIIGECKILYRHFMDAADMIAADLYMNTGSSSLLNNGAFELHFMQDNQDIYIKKGNPLLCTFLTLSNSTAFTGYHSKTVNQSWNSMIQDGYVNQAESNYNKVMLDSFPVKRNFWQWIGDVFTGNKAEWNTYERVALNKDVAEFDKNKYRTFEIAEAGLFASAALSTAGSGASKTVQLSSHNNDELSNVVYQVFINNNMVKKYTLDNTGAVNLDFATSDRCILIVPIANSRYLAVLDANGFDRLVKNAGIQSAFVQTYGSEINTIPALRKLIDTYSNQRPMRH